MPPFRLTHDWTYSEGCGCQVTFFAAADFYTSRMLPGVACTRHTGKYQMDARSDFIERAQNELAAAKLSNEPRT